MIEPNATGWNVYRFTGKDDSDQVFVGSAATEDAAIDIAMHDGGDQVQQGLDGAVRNIYRSNWFETAKQ